ncbi:hypothetical protein HPB47_020165 [Ixodes persulcatus]|uniref:Uncharacterized protein n=1 Tax=Ixodes persulcatus TaxID=34615 RepID=A0AC60QG67_IXOPE|nr:hypothetical protein HPB47_020165 [Ixodes persulcatus]
MPQTDVASGAVPKVRCRDARRLCALWPKEGEVGLYLDFFDLRKAQNSRTKAKFRPEELRYPSGNLRRQLSQLWQDAVDFLGRNESRVRTERQHIDGESYLVWRWLGGAASPPGSPSATPPRAKVWQGRAFESPGSGLPGGATGGSALPYVPATCLKIRNMFDLEVEYECDWPVQIRNAILEKCEGNQGIVHLQVDTASKEGCVYMKCSSLEAAGQAYRALHGSWFDGNLITVKYLRLERYHERFPESQYCREPLKPSNSLRLSLDASNSPEEDAL